MPAALQRARTLLAPKTLRRQIRLNVNPSRPRQAARPRTQKTMADALIRHIGIIGASIEALADILVSKPLANGPLWFSSPVGKPFPQFARRKLGRTDLAMRPRKRLLSMPINYIDRMAFAASKDVGHASIMIGAETGTRHRLDFPPLRRTGLKLQRPVRARLQTRLRRHCVQAPSLAGNCVAIGVAA
jgi:hypothetical protein